MGVVGYMGTSEQQNKVSKGKKRASRTCFVPLWPGNFPKKYENLVMGGNGCVRGHEWVRMGANGCGWVQ